jgi:hypothetical protein
VNLSDEELMLLEQLTYIEDIVFKAAGIEDVPPIEEINSIEELLVLFDDEALAQLDEAGVLKYPNDPDNPDDDTDSLFLQGNEWAALIREIKDSIGVGL